MKECCNPPSSRVAYLPPADPSDATGNGAATTGAALLDGAFLCVPQGPSKDFRELIADLRSRQESYFREVLGQQKELQNQLSAMYSTSQIIAHEQAAMKRRQADLVSEFRDFSSKFGASKSAAMSIAETNVMTKHGHVAQVAQCGTGELVGDVFSDAEQGCSPWTSSAAAELNESTCQSEPGSPVSPKQSIASRGKSKDSLNFGNVQPYDDEVNDNGNTLVGQARRLLKRKEFELTIAFAILVNAFIMCWECQYVGLDVGFNLRYPGRTSEAHIIWAGAETAFDIFDWSFGILFFLEMLVKIACFRCRYFYDSSALETQSVLRLASSSKFRCWRSLQNLQGWNILDFLCVDAFLFEKMSGGIRAINPQMIRLLRLFRLFRLVRLLRFLETLDHLYVMTTAIAGLSKVLAWAIILLTIMLLTCDLLLVQILHATYFDKVNATSLSPEELKRHHEMYAYFGTCTRCMLSMFEITLGNWPPVARLLSEEVSEWFTLVCLLHKLTIGFAVIGVITGVILQETFKVAQTDDVIMFRQKKQQVATMQKKMQMLFHALDDSGDGLVDFHEFVQIAHDPEMRTWLGSLDIETDDLEILFTLVDENKDGMITVDELISRMPRIKGAARSIDTLWVKQKIGALLASQIS